MKDIIIDQHLGKTDLNELLVDFMTKVHEKMFKDNGRPDDLRFQLPVDETGCTAEHILGMLQSLVNQGHIALVEDGDDQEKMQKLAIEMATFAAVLYDRAAANFE